MNFPLLQIKDGFFSILNRPILVDINFKVNEGDRICLIGRNGSGKSSLMKIITANYELDRGEIILRKNLKIGYLAQNMEEFSNETIYDFVLKDVVKDDEIKEQKKYLADIILDNLKLDGLEFMTNLSGGKLRRAHLAKGLILQPDLLLLDEPTNHLDIISIEWLEEYIKTYPGGILCVSHDKKFLSNATNKTMWLDRTRLRFHNQGFADFNRWSEQIMLEEEAKIQKMSRKLEEENSWLHGGVTGRRKRNQQRLQNLFNLRKKLSEERGKANILSARIKLPDLTPAAASKLVIEMEGVSFSYPNSEEKLLDEFSLRINKGEKIGVIGPNGCGKTSFVRLITGELKPDKGIVRLGSNAEVSYFDQKRESLQKDKTLWQILCPQGGDMVKIGDKTRHVVAYLKDFLFDSKQIKDKVEFLSGGEANRLLLAKTLANPGTLLILDEPTNDLDMDSLEMLLELLTDYKGTLLLVSHDREFLNELVTRSLIFTPDGIIDNIGGYEDYQKFAKKNSVNSLKNKPNNSQNQLDYTAKSTNKLSFKLQYELDKLPNEIEVIFQDINKLEKDLEDNREFYAKNSKSLNEISDQIGKLRKLLTKKEERWIELEMIKADLG